jgi:hypothetical protein
MIRYNFDISSNFGLIGDNYFSTITNIITRLNTFLITKYCDNRLHDTPERLINQAINRTLENIYYYKGIPVDAPSFFISSFDSSLSTINIKIEKLYNGSRFAFKNSTIQMIANNYILKSFDTDLLPCVDTIISNSTNDIVGFNINISDLYEYLLTTKGKYNLERIFKREG